MEESFIPPSREAVSAARNIVDELFDLVTQRWVIGSNPSSMARELVSQSDRLVFVAAKLGELRHLLAWTPTDATRAIFDKNAA